MSLTTVSNSALIYSLLYLHHGSRKHGLKNEVECSNK